MPAAFVDPARLRAPSPTPSESDHDEDSPAPQPSRKRPRTDMTTEERKEARAHRNRIAAQNSRDRRKAQFSQLNSRVAELEEENKQLKEALSLYRSKQQPTPQVVPTFTDSTRERENEELRERVRSLEKSWESVVRMLASQTKSGATTALPSPPVSSSSDSGNSPLFAHASPTLSMLSAHDESLDEHTRHSAAGVSDSSSSDDSKMDSSSPNNSIINNNSVKSEPIVEDWFMDLLSSSPSAETLLSAAASSSASPLLGSSKDTSSATHSPIAATPASVTVPTASFEWDTVGTASDDMQTLLALLPPPDVARDELAGLGLDIGAVSGAEPWTAWTGASDAPIAV